MWRRRFGVMALTILLLLLCARVDAAYLNLGADSLYYPNASQATSATTAGTAPITVAQFADGAIRYALYNVPAVPQDMAAGAKLKCGFVARDNAATPSTNGVCFLFEAAAFPAAALYNATWPAGPTLSAAVCGNPTATQAQTFTATAGVFTNVYNVQAAADCASTTCNGTPLKIRVRRDTTDAGDTNADTIELIKITCEY